jgi:hypothetical protein
MQHKDGLLEDLGLAIEELQRASMFLEIVQALIDLEPCVDPSTRTDWIALLIKQALLTNETAVDFLQVWPDRLTSGHHPLYYVG